MAADFRAAAARETAAHHLRPQFYAVGSVAVVAVALTAYGIWHRGERAQAPAVQVHGAVLASQDASAAAVVGVPFTPVLAKQPDNGEALGMRAELVSHEGERDAVLGFARLCARDGQWVCAWHNAGHALTIDASSEDARALLSRSIAEHGASASRSFDPSLPGADEDQ